MGAILFSREVYDLEAYFLRQQSTSSKVFFKYHKFYISFILKKVHYTHYKISNRAFLNIFMRYSDIIERVL